ncbi:MAG: hypothetical protein ACXAAI_04755 [Promethearchaeota archaeon]|jgi:hypothetical protein
MYNTLKTHDKKIYTGMQIGGTHHWSYTKGKWFETKKAPDQWSFKFESLKTRINPAPVNTGASIKTQYHWYILADQIATKIDANSYITSMKGIKFKIGHKRPYWRTFSYNYPEQSSYKERIIKILEDTLNNLKNSS